MKKIIVFFILVIGCIMSLSTTINATEVQEVEEVAKKFIDAVNANNLEEASKYATTQVIKDIKDYKISNISISDYTDYEYKEDMYIYTDNYTCGLSGVTDIKDIGLGRIFIVKKVDGKYTVTSVCATGYSSGTEEVTEEEKVKEVAKKFIDAVNANNLEEASKYATTQVIKDIKDYKISNISISDYTDYEYKEDMYIYTDNYTCGLSGVTDIKDIGLGRIFIVKKVDGKYTVTSVCATGYSSGTEEDDKDLTIANGKLPQTGINDNMLIISISIVILVISVLIIKLKYKDIK